MKAVTVGLVDIGRDSDRRIYFRQQYIDRLHEAEANVLMIPQEEVQSVLDRAGAENHRLLTQRETEEIRAFLVSRLDCCDGLLLPGGGDIDPKYWGAKREEWSEEPNETRDTMEPILLREAMRRNMPVLGICRGIQCMNVFCGGSLYQDVIKEHATAFAGHSDSARNKERVHGVTLKEGSWLAETLGVAHVGVNSMHHQAVHRVAPGFAVTAVSDDGLVEGIEYQGEGFCVGIQWYPEHMAPELEEQRRIFSGFVRECRNARAATR